MFPRLKEMDSNGNLTGSSANDVLNRDIGDITRRNGNNVYAFPGVGGGTIWLPSDCAAVASALTQAYLVYNRLVSYNRPNFFPLFWNTANNSSPTPEARRLERRGGHTFYGTRGWWRIP